MAMVEDGMVPRGEVLLDYQPVSGQYGINTANIRSNTARIKSARCMMRCAMAVR